MTEPRRDTEILSPKAIDNSFPLNHFDTIADWATESDSPPRLNIIIE